MQSAIRFHPPSYDIRVETIPTPRISDPDDAIVKVKYAGLCGSDLHAYRGHEIVDQVHTCGHEFIGEIVELGSAFGKAIDGRAPLYSTLKVGDKVVSPFTTNCGECAFCRAGVTCRCIHSKLFGCPALEGAQAQYVRVPKAGGTLYSLSDPALSQKYSSWANISDSSLLFLGDILPTGLFAALQAIHHPKLQATLSGIPWPLHMDTSPSVRTESPKDITLTFAIVGLGPVGLCAMIALADQASLKGFKLRIVGVDLNEARRQKAERVYATVCQTEGYTDAGISFVTYDGEAAKSAVSEYTEGAGCDAVLEIVGHDSALNLAYDLVRPFGVISSVGVHSERPFPLSGGNLYDKNVSMDFGRCPARAMLPIALDLLVKRQDVFAGVGTDASLVDRIVGMGDAVEMYKLFDKGDIGKVLFQPWE
ncbi:alcohol dehydrogenase [Cylindrobasidium torrendii FP15055 ss-10]|uniref:Alcohol dehydrogenase n=1 Tax=Cylindrobasidium torrendii FP15055 ss-10 TaxID=1314674 RepID=A0A0D7BMH0_9AGAR|nr:alcohol dehydrogenase [Cylindrobasidium torrendii FP15055 ss-10]